MGYNTDFFGEIDIEPALTPELKDYLIKFSRTRRMKRNIVKLKEMFGNEHGLEGNHGTEGEFFVGRTGAGFMEEIGHPTIINYNDPPVTQPGLWCNFLPNDEGTAIVWNETEKTYDGAEWIKYIIETILAPRGYVCNGEMAAQGDERDDIWKIIVEDNKVRTVDGTIDFVQGECTGCGNEVHLNDNYCSKCGIKLKEEKVVM